MKKIIFALIAIGILAVGGLATAQNNGWVGTDWITSGSLIPSAELKASLDYLQENKVHKPADCTGVEERLTWLNGEWVCQEGAFTPTDPADPTNPVDPRSDCTFNGNTVDDGQSISAYQTASVGFGETCNQQTRTCNDGTLSGSFTNSSCTVGTASSCSFAGGSIAHGQVAVAYQTASVGFGETCNQQTRTCNDGTLSGSFTNSSCTVEPAATCTFAGNTVAHNASVTAYQSDSVQSPAACISENRTCADGTLSGSFTNTSCVVTPAFPANDCPDHGVIIEVLPFGPVAAEIREDLRCSCQTAVVGGNYGRNLTCHSGLAF